MELVSDSQVTVKGINEWLPNWIRQQFKKTKNVDLWKTYLEASKEHTVVATWVRGHSGHPENELCDELAREQALRLHGALHGDS